MHRDIKPDNLVFGSLSEENIKFKKEIGIIDFGHSKILTTKSGKLNYTSKFYKCKGNKNFSSTNALLDNDTRPFDDIETIFYLLIYFLNG